MRSLKDNIGATVDLGVVLMIGIAFAGLVVIVFIVYTIRDLFMTAGNPSGFSGSTEQQDFYGNAWNNSVNITQGFDDAINLILVAITIVILAIAISALLLLRGR